MTTNIDNNKPIQPNSTLKDDSNDLLDTCMHDTKRLGNFSFFEVNPKRLPFKYKAHPTSISSNDFKFIDNKKDFSLVFFINCANDSLENTKKLNQTIKSIYLSWPELEKCNIKNTNILIIAFVLDITSSITFSELYPHLDYLSSCCNNDSSYNCSYLFSLSTNCVPISALCFNKNNSSEVDSIKLFYLNILGDIFYHSGQHETGHRHTKIHLIGLENGVILTLNTISNFLSICKEKPMAIVPQINSISSNWFGDIQNFQYIYEQVFTLNHYQTTSATPLNHKCHYIFMDFLWYRSVLLYYTYNICNDARVFYHDYKFANYLYQNGFPVLYWNAIQVYYYERNNISFNDILKTYSDRTSGYYLMVLHLMKWAFLKSEQSNHLKGVIHVLKKIFLSFQIFDTVLTFLTPSITIMLCYIIFCETFISEDPRIPVFFTMLYIIFFCITCSFSLLSKKQSLHDRTYILLNVLFYIYYVFVLGCSVVSIHHLKTNNNHDPYVFNIVPWCVLLILNVLCFSTPIICYARVFWKSYSNALKFIVIASPAYLSVFNIHSMVNWTDHYGTRDKRVHTDDSFEEVWNERKKVFVWWYLLSNGLFSCFCFFMVSRSIRVRTIMLVATVYTVLHGVKTIAILVGIGMMRKNNDKIRKINSSVMVVHKLINVETSSELKRNIDDEKVNFNKGLKNHYEEK